MKRTMMTILAVTSVLALAGAAQAATISAELIGYWGFDEGTGTTTADATGNNTAATLENGAGWTVSRPTQLSHSTRAIDLGKWTSQYVAIGNPAGLDGATDWSMSLWVYLKETTNWNNWFGVISKRDSYNARDWTVYMENYTSDNSFSFQGSNGVKLTGTFTPAEWSHFVLTKAGSAYTLYVDGSPVATATSATALGIGDAIGVGLFDGEATGAALGAYFDDLSLWSGALTADDVTALWNGANPIPEPATMGLLVAGGIATLLRRRRRA